MGTYSSNEVAVGYNGHYHLYMTIKVNSQSVANNTSNVTVKMYAKSDSSSYGAWNSDADNTVKMTVNGSEVTNKKIGMDFRNQATVNLAEWTGNITHGSDGKKTLSCSGSFSFPNNSWLSGGSISCSLALDSIARATKPTLSATSVELGKAVTITVKAATSGWKHSLWYSFKSDNTGCTKITENVTAQTYSWTIPLTLASKITTSTSAKLYIGVKTYDSSGKQIGTTQSTGMTVTIPSSVVPVVNTITVAEAVSSVSTAIGAYVQNKSKFKVTVTATGTYGSMIKSINCNVDEATYAMGTSTTVTTDYIQKNGSVPIKVTVIDSRGRTGTKTQNVTVLAYSQPKISTITCYRCDTNGSMNSSGTSVKLVPNFSVSKLTVGSTDKNKCAYVLAYKKAENTAYTTLVSGNSYSYSTATITDKMGDVNQAYKAKLTVTDSFGTYTQEIDVPKASRLISYIAKKTAIAMGKIASKANAFEVDLVSYFNKHIHLNGNIYTHVTDTWYVWDSIKNRAILDYSPSANRIGTKAKFEIKTMRLYLTHRYTLTAANTNLKIPFDAESHTANAQSQFVFTDNGIKCIEAGWVLVSFISLMASVGKGDHITIGLRKAGSLYSNMYRTWYTNGEEVSLDIPMTMIYVNAGEIIDVFVKNQTGARGLLESGVTTSLTVSYIG